MKEMANIKIRRELYSEIEDLIEKESWLGYNSVTSFCVEGIRKLFFESNELIKDRNSKKEKFDLK